MNRAMMTLLDRHVVHDVVTQFFIRVDAQDWTGVRKLLATEVNFDMSAAGTGPPAVRTGDELVDEMQRTLAPLESTHHQIGNVVVRVNDEEETASVLCHGLAFHHRERPGGPDTRMYAGRYSLGLCQQGHQWRIDELRLELRFAQGGTELETLPMRDSES